MDAVLSKASTASRSIQFGRAGGWVGDSQGPRRQQTPPLMHYNLILLVSDWLMTLTFGVLRGGVSAATISLANTNNSRATVPNPESHHASGPSARLRSYISIWLE